MNKSVKRSRGSRRWQAPRLKSVVHRRGIKAVRKLSKVGAGRSYTVALPREVVRHLGWQERQKLTIEADLRNKKLIIRDWKK